MSGFRRARGSGSPPIWFLAATSATCIGVVALSGYLLHAGSLSSVVPGWPRMSPANAIMSILGGMSLMMSAPAPAPRGRRWAGRVLAAGLVVVAALVLLGHGSLINLAFEHLLSSAADAENAASGRPPIRSPAAFLLIGLSLLVLDASPRRGHLPAQLLATAGGLLVTVLTALTVLLGFRTIYDQDAHSHFMSVLTPVAVLLLATAILTSRPDGLTVKMFTSTQPGGHAVRRLAPAVAAVALTVTGVVASVGYREIAADGLVVTIGISASLMTLYLVLLRTGYMLNEAETRQQSLLSELRDQRNFNDTVLMSLNDGILVLAPDGTVLRTNARWSAITGYPAEDVIGLKAPYPWWDLGTIERHHEDLTAALRSASRTEFYREVRRPDGTLIPVFAAVSPLLVGADRTGMVIVTYRDLTQRDEDEAERRRIARELDHFFTMSQDLLCIAGTDGYFHRINPAWGSVLGYTEDELLDRPFTTYLHPDDVDRTIAETAGLATGGNCISFENRYRARDGSYHWLNWNATAAEQGGVIYAAARDITERRQSFEAAARFAAIVEGTADGVIGKALDGTIVSWNPAATRIYGYPADEMIGRNIGILFPHDHLDDLADILQRTARGETIRSHDTIRRHRDGSIVHLALTISPVRDSDGNVIGAASIAHDITDAKKAEQRFEQLIRSAPEAIIIADTDGTIRLVNEQTERLFGYTSDELIGRPVDLLVPDAASEQHPHDRLGYLTAPSARAIGQGREISARRRNGTEFPSEISLAPLDTDEGTLVSAVIRDVSERRKVEHAAAVVRDEALAAAKAKSQFVATVSHEIRTPMNGVIGLTKLLLDTPLQPTQRRYAEAIRSSGRALLTIINDILDFSKIEAGKIALVHNNVDLGELVEEVAHVAASTAREKDLDIITYYPPNMPACVRADEGRIRQVLLNLTSNAVKFTARGHVIIRVDLAPAGSHGRRPYTFSITDTGVGIDPADIARLFEPFTQVDGTISREFGGTGLGLSISHELVALMGGNLEADSEPGHGSRFHFTITLVEPGDGPRKGHRIRDELGALRLLLVDAKPTSRKFLTEHILAWGVSVTDVATVDDAIRELTIAAGNGEYFDVTVVDHHPPELDGSALITRTHGDAAIPDLACVLLSRDPSAEHDTINLEGVDVLAKPVGPSALYNYLLRQLQPHRHNTPGPHAPDTDATPARRTRGLVLLAEDNEINQLVAIDTLNTLGYDADIAHNGAEAIELASSKPYQAILMDCQMPKLDGYQATEELRRRESPGQHIPIIAMTAGVLEEDRQHASQAGMDDFLTKPIDPDDLRAALERWTVDTPTGT